MPRGRSHDPSVEPAANSKTAKRGPGPARSPTRSKSLNAANLEALGTAKLAELLIEVSKGNAVAQRRLRLALAGSAGGAEAARVVAKRLTSIAGGRTWLDWRKIKPFAAELDSQRRAILDLVAPTEPREAFELMWRLSACGDPVLGRSDDGGGHLSGVFHDAVRDLGPLAERARVSAEELAARVFRTLCADQHDVYDDLIQTLAGPLGAAGLAALKQALEAWQAEPAPPPPARDRKPIGWGPSGPVYADQIKGSHRRQRSQFLLQQVADATGDTDGFIAQYDAATRRVPGIASGIARRLLQAGRAEEALAALDAVEPAHRDRAPIEWDQARTDVLDVLGRTEEAQAFRWQRFLATLNPDHLRAHLRKLPDFDDFEAEQRALDHALGFKDVHKALAFLVTWPDLKRADTLVRDRRKALNGDYYEVLSPAADTLDAKYPLAATLLRRAMIDLTLRAGKSARYKHAARHLLDCRDAAGRVEGWGTLPDHAAYERALQATHGRKAAFWHEVTALQPDGPGRTTP